MEKIKLSQLFPYDEVLNGYGIFAYLSQLDTQTPPQPLFPLISDFINQDNNATLDIDYEIGYSADKYLSPLAVKTLIRSLELSGWTLEDFINGDVTGSDLKSVIEDFLDTLLIGSAIYNRFGLKWNKIYDALIDTAYNPLHNYDMEEKRTPNITHTETYNSVTDTRTPNLTTSGSANATTGVYGFNGSTAKNSGVNDGTSSESVTGTDTNVKTGNVTNAETGTDTITRKGNIGVTTSQQLIDSELELRKHDFYRIIYNDIDSILCLKIY